MINDSFYVFPEKKYKNEVDTLKQRQMTHARRDLPGVERTQKPIVDAFEKVKVWDVNNLKAKNVSKKIMNIYNGRSFL